MRVPWTPSSIRFCAVHDPLNSLDFNLSSLISLLTSRLENSDSLPHPNEERLLENDERLLIVFQPDDEESDIPIGDEEIILWRTVWNSETYCDEVFLNFALSFALLISLQPISDRALPLLVNCDTSATKITLITNPANTITLFPIIDSRHSK